MQNDPKNKIKNNYLSSFPYLTSKKSKSFFSVVLTLCTLSFFGFFAITPTVTTIFGLQKEIEDNKIVLKQLDDKIISLNELKKQYSNLVGDLPIIANAVPMQPYPHLLFAQIRSIAQTLNVTIGRLQNSQIEIIKNSNVVNSDINSYSFTIDGSGSQENIYKFIKKLANMERIISIDTFSFREDDIGATLQGPKFSVQGTAFFKDDL